jgi:hypothetical protein
MDEAQIYLIENTINNKKYIGTTKKMYGNINFGYENRFKHHMTNAFIKSKENDCPRFYNAIRKYGKDNFRVELLKSCSMEERGHYEKYYIDFYKSYDDKYGYNISLGGDGRSVSFVNEDIRTKISAAQTTIGECNIKPYYKNNILVGYYVKRRDRGNIINKYFTSSKYSPVENYNKATEFLNKIKNGDFTNDNPYNRTDNLPTNITKIYNKSKTVHIGFLVCIRKYNINKRFTVDSLDINLDNAKKYLEQVLNEVKTIYTDVKTSADNPQQSS